MHIAGFIPVSPYIYSGRIDPEEAISLYRAGSFPMAEDINSPHYTWYRYAPRGILPIANLHISKSLKKFIKKSPYDITCDTAFDDVINACATMHDCNNGGTWINNSIIDLFNELHNMGLAHSIECWKDGELAGGIYGLHIGGMFCGESMFARADNASKIALIHLTKHLGKIGASFIDTQMVTPVTKQMGAIAVHDEDYTILREHAIRRELQWGDFDPHHHKPENAPHPDSPEVVAQP